MNNCGIRIPESQVANSLIKIAGSDNILLSAMYANAVSDDKLKKEFIEWYNTNVAKRNKLSNDSLNNHPKATVNKIANAIKDYFYKNHPSVDNFIRKIITNDKINELGYNSVFDREFGKKLAGTLAIDIFNELQNKGLDVPEKAYEYYLMKIRTAWLKTVMIYAAKVSDNTYEGVKRGYDLGFDKLAHLENLLKGSKELSITASNILAVYKELFGSDITAINYLKEVFASNRLSDVYAQIKKNLDAESSKLAIEASKEQNELSDDQIVVLDEEELDTMITTANNHIGMYSSFMTHIGPRIRNYFNTLRKQISPTINDLDTNNSFGIADTMDANACSSMLYNNGDFHNIETMIESINKIGNTIAGFEAFTKLAQDLKNNKDFATEMFTVFAKTKMLKVETVIENGKPITRIANKDVEPRNAFIFDLLNDAKSVVENISETDFNYTINNLLHDIYNINNQINQLNKIDNKDKETKAEFSQLLSAKIGNTINKTIHAMKQYYPSLDEGAIKSFIAFNNNASNDFSIITDNLNLLLTDMKASVEGSKKAKAEKNSRDLKAAEIKDYNTKLDHLRENGEIIDDAKYLAEIDVYGTDYLQHMNASIQSLVDKLLPYTIVKTNLNHRNIHGNNNSDVINNSWLTGLKKMLDDFKEVTTIVDGKTVIKVTNPTLINWGIKKLKSSQYKYSNILLEQHDPNDPDIIINKDSALFKYENGQLVLSDNAKNNLKLRLYNGSSNLDTDTNVDYTEMTKGDFLPTSFLQFFTTEDTQVKDLRLANYFLRTPSDAPKTFTIRAVRHDTKDLLKLKDEQTHINNVKKVLDEVIPTMSLHAFKNNFANTNAEIVETETLLKYIADPSYINVLRNDFLIPAEEEGTYYYKAVNQDLGIVVFKGTKEKNGKGNKLTNAEVVGVINYDIESKQDLSGVNKSIYKLYYDKYYDLLQRENVIVNDTVFNKSERIINTQHNAFLMIKNQFKQELHDAAKAVVHYFEMATSEKTGLSHVVIEPTDGTNVYEAIFKEGRNNNKGYKFYHLDKNGNVVTYNHTNNTYTLGGAVFGSNKFTLYKANDTKATNYMSDLFSHTTIGDDTHINFLYGGAIEYLLDEQGDLIDIKLNDKIDKLIDEKISNFLKDYIDQSSERIHDYEDFINYNLSEDNIIEYSINQLIMHYNYDELFEGDTKFYKDAQTILKRAKEYQGSGVPYGLSDYTNFGDYNLNDVSSDLSFLNGGSIDVPKKRKNITKKGIEYVEEKDENGNIITEKISIQEYFNTHKNPLLKGVTQRNGFRAATISNTQMTNHKALKALATQLEKQGLDHEHAMELLYGPIVMKDGKPIIDSETGQPKRRGGFTDTKVNDAQSYITIQEWVRRVAAKGQLQRYMPVIKRLLDETQPLSGEDIKEFVQVQKNFYYDLAYNDEYGIETPRQIKNAEFVLIPRLIKGTELEVVYNMMREANIDQLNTIETSKASNETILTIWDNDSNMICVDKDGNINNEKYKEIVDGLNQNAQIYSYNYLYTQQETPQHMNAKNKAGIQIVKKIVDNIPMDDSKLGQLKKEYFKLFTQNIRNSFDKLMTEFNVPLDENGNIDLDEDGHIKSIDNKIFYEKLREEMMRTGLDSNLADYVTIEEGESSPKMPSYMNNIIIKFESVVQSLFNSGITRQKLPGFHSAQITNIGWRALQSNPVPFVNKNNPNDKISLDDYNALDSKAKKEYKDTRVTYDKDLQYHPNVKKLNGKIISEAKYAKLSDEDKSKVITEPAGYIEVMMPASFLGIDRSKGRYANMTSNEILKEVQADGLDMIIGYRIPTEGKQSVCNMKVVGILEDITGSTIVVPNDWVSQTGSDFDIDSVYGIQFETYKDKDGRIRKYDYKHSVNYFDYLRYIKRFSEEAKNLVLNDEVKQKIENLQKESEEKYKEITDEISNIFTLIPADVKQIDWKITQELVKKGLGKLDEYNKFEAYEGKAEEAMLYRYENRIKQFKKILSLCEKKAKGFENISEGVQQNYKDFINANEKAISYISDRKTSFEDEKLQAKNEVLDEHLKKLSNIAKELGLMSYTEFIDPNNIEKANSEKARNTRILEIMQEILNDTASLEENLSRSNFDDLVAAKNKIMSKAMAAERENRSPYNVFDQMSYQEEAMSGAKLKAMSVTLDTFCSVCNTIRPILETPIYVVYSKEDFKDYEKDIERFNGEKPDDKSKTFEIKHNTYGYSNDNRSIGGKILTAYSSQTTAFILDAIKEGSIPNVNEYTFSTFKTLLNCGINYDTAMAFIMQPGVTEIVKASNAKKSVFYNGGGNEIFEAIKSVAKRLGIDTEYKSVNKVLAEINKEYNKEFNNIFAQSKDKQITISLTPNHLKNLPLIVDKLKKRIDGKSVNNKRKSSPIEEALFDLGTILSFYSIHSTAEKIQSIARCCNPDKFGAKQSVFATRQVFNNIIECIKKVKEDITVSSTGVESELESKNRKPILTVDGNHILNAIYPGISDVTPTIKDILKHIISYKNIQDSKYPTLFAFLKYASATSVVIGQEIFDTQKDGFVAMIEGFTRVLSGFNPKITEEVYTDLQKYAISSFYKQVKAIKYPVKVRVQDNNITINYKDRFEEIETDDEKEIKAQQTTLERYELNRIYGYERDPDIKYLVRKKIIEGDKTTYNTYWEEFSVKDINNPTEDEIKNYEKLSPAQKIKWIQSNFSNAGLFSLITSNLKDSVRGGKNTSMQSLTFIDQNIDSNVIYAEFQKVFFSTNPLLISAAIDIVKYATLVEGFNMSATAINKVIDNDILINSLGSEGIGFVDEIKAQMNQFNTLHSAYSHTYEWDMLYENYLRSHPDKGNFRTIYMNKHTQSTYGISKQAFNMYYLSTDSIPNEDKSYDEIIKEFNASLEKLGIVYYDELAPKDKQYKANTYVRISNYNGTVTLYKIHKATDHVILYPLGKLQTNENAQWSINENNNKVDGVKILSSYGYNKLITEYERLRRENNNFSDKVKEIYDNFKETGETKDFWYSERKYMFVKTPAVDFNLEELAKQGGALSVLRDDIIKYYAQHTTGEPSFYFSPAITDYITTPGIPYGSIQELQISNGVYKKFTLAIPQSISKIEKALEKDENGNFMELPDSLPKQVRDIIEKGRERGAKKLTGLIAVVPNNELGMASEDEESEDYDFENDNLDDLNINEDMAKVLIHGLNYASSRMNEGNKLAVDLIEKLRLNNINNSEESLKQNVNLVTREVAKFASKTAEYISRELFKQFVKDPNSPDSYLDITDPKVSSIIKNDAELMNKYFKSVNTAKAFLNTFAHFVDLNTNSEDADIKHFINNIKESYDKINRLPITQVLETGNRILVKEASTNPTIREGLVDVMDGFWKTYGSMWQFHDIMENGTPILQVILKQVASDITAKEQHFNKIRKAYRQRIKEIYDKARERGEVIDLEKIVDEDGRTREDFSPEFIDDYNALYDAEREAARKTHRGSIEHLKAKLELDIFKAKHINQKARKDYYLLKAQLEKELLYGNKDIEEREKQKRLENPEDYVDDDSNPITPVYHNGIPELYSAYMTLYYQKSEILSLITEEGLDEEDRKTLDEIDKKIYNLYRKDFYVKNGEIINRPILNEGVTDLDEYKLYSEENAFILRNFIKRIGDLTKAYFEYEEAYGFDDMLKTNLKIIRDKESIPNITQTQLDADETYTKAKDWVRTNARFIVNITTDPNTGEATSIGAKLKKILTKFSLAKNGKTSKAKFIENEANNGNGIYDYKGIPDGRLLTKDEIDDIRKEQEMLYGSKICPPFTDRILLSNANPNNELYDSSFYMQMATSGDKSSEYYESVTEINKILRKYRKAGTISLEFIEDNEEGIAELTKLGELYQKLRECRPTASVDSEFINNNVEFVVNKTGFNVSGIAVAGRSEEFKKAWCTVMFDRKKDGEYITIDGKYQANRYLWSYARPNSEENRRYYSEKYRQTQEEITLLNNVYKKRLTSYYYEAQRLAKEQGEEYYENWWFDNHVWNPIKQEYEALDCWITTEINDLYFEDNTFEARWVPRSSQREKKVRNGHSIMIIGGQEIDNYDKNLDMRNPNYDENKSIIENWAGDDFLDDIYPNNNEKKYASKIKLNKSEKELRDYFKEILLSTATTEQARRYFKKGYLPKAMRPKDISLKDGLKEATKLFGFNVATQNGNKSFYNDDEIGYERDYTPTMPMTQLLNNVQTIDLSDKIKKLKEEEIKEEDYNTKEEYLKAVTEHENSIKELEEQLRKDRNALLNRDWITVIESFLSQAQRYNAIQDNKQKLYFLLNSLEHMKMYSRKFGGYGDLKQDRSSSEQNPVYEKSIDENLIKQYKNYLRRLLYDQWKETEGKFTTLANNLQGFASANYMMLNVRGGIANVTLGEMGILSEACAKEYLGKRNWAFGTNEWSKGSIGFARNAFHQMLGHEYRAYNKQDAIIQYFRVIDYDEITGVVRKSNMEEFSKKIRDFMFSPQTITEHFMQNSVLFGMLKSHKIVNVDGKPKAMTERQYIDYQRYTNLREILTEEQLKEFNKFKKKIKKNKDVLKEYAWFRKDALTNFIYLHGTKEQINNFIKQNEKIDKKAKEEFKNKVDLYKQLELGDDGQMKFKDDSELARLDEQLANNVSSISLAEELLGQFTEKVKKVNNKIHGVYNRQGAAYIERKWYGSLIMQYHKHLPMGLLKRYMARGHWNEFRESVDKGMWQSINDVASLNWEKIKVDTGMSDKQFGALEGFMFFMLHSFDYFTQLYTTLKVIPPYERANLLRNLGDVVGVVGAMATVAALWYIADDDKEMQDSLGFNLMLYEADRLCSESFLYNPWGMVNETKKLMSTPIAAQSIISDAASTVKSIFDWILDDEYDPYYHSGRFAGEHKLSVYIQRRIPIWNGIRSILDTPSNNHYYKLGQSPIGLFDVKKLVTGEN